LIKLPNPWSFGIDENNNDDDDDDDDDDDGDYDELI